MLDTNPQPEGEVPDPSKGPVGFACALFVHGPRDGALVTDAVDGVGRARQNRRGSESLLSWKARQAPQTGTLPIEFRLGGQ